MTFGSKRDNQVTDHLLRCGTTRTGLRPGRGYRGIIMSERQRGAADIPSPRDRTRRFQIIETQTRQESEQGVPDYDPQVVALRWLFLATIVYRIAVGRA